MTEQFAFDRLCAGAARGVVAGHYDSKDVVIFVLRGDIVDVVVSVDFASRRPAILYTVIPKVDIVSVIVVCLVSVAILRNAILRGGVSERGDWRDRL